ARPSAGQRVPWPRLTAWLEPSPSPSPTASTRSVTSDGNLSAAKVTFARWPSRSCITGSAPTVGSGKRSGRGSSSIPTWAGLGVLHERRGRNRCSLPDERDDRAEAYTEGAEAPQNMGDVAHRRRDRSDQERRGGASTSGERNEALHRTRPPLERVDGSRAASHRARVSRRAELPARLAR